MTKCDSFKCSPKDMERRKEWFDTVVRRFDHLSFTTTPPTTSTSGQSQAGADAAASSRRPRTIKLRTRSTGIEFPMLKSFQNNAIAHHHKHIRRHSDGTTNNERQQKSALKKGKRNRSGEEGDTKLSVRFADTEGKSLATFREVEPTDHHATLPHLREISKASCTTDDLFYHPYFKRTTLKPNFKLKDTYSYEFQSKLQHQKVCLQRVEVLEDLSVTGRVVVLNMDYHKAVYVRYTRDKWRTMTDLQARFIPSVMVGDRDWFAFQIPPAPGMEPGDTLVMAIRFHCAGQQFWDNNDSDNYEFVCIEEVGL